jgi:hypothetical protein
LLDGRNRLDAFEAAGYTIVDKEDRSTPGQAHPRLIHNHRLLDWIEVRGLDGVDPYAYVISANIHRRYLSTAQKIELVEKVITANPKMSGRQAAKLAGVSPTTATKTRAKLEKAGDVSTVDTSIDTRGRQQPIHKPKTVSVKPPPPPTPAQRVEEKIRQAGNRRT